MGLAKNWLTKHFLACKNSIKLYYFYLALVSADGFLFPVLRQAFSVVRKLTSDQITMKLLTMTFLVTLPFNLFSQNKVAGSYRDYFGSKIRLNANKTFKYTWNFDMSASWTKGTWTCASDTVYFHIIPIYDTLSRKDINGIASDTLILSTNEVSERFKQMQFAAMALTSGGQSSMAAPNKLLFRKDRLYKIQNGKLIVQKQKGFWTDKKFDPWFFKSAN
ncbi:hypothetical protein EON73_03365 [bacterium]|nr:MAG: hypothetical protein EON73_03365 [bacterium]